MIRSKTEWGVCAGSTTILGNELDLHLKGGRFKIEEITCDSAEELAEAMKIFAGTEVHVKLSEQNSMAA